MLHRDPHDAITSGIAFIARHQLTSGNFSSYSSPSPLSFNTKKSYQTTFIPSFILLALNTLADKQDLLAPITAKLSRYLLSQKSDQWTWNYWDRSSPEYTQKPYPDDLDDTFLAMAALYQYDNSLIDGQSLAHLVQILTILEIKEGGPYRTWLANDDSSEQWHDADVVVNSNIAAFLSLHEVELPQVISFVEKAILSEKFTTPYYSTPYPALYSLSRWYRGKLTQNLIPFLIALASTDQHPLYTALTLSSLIRFNYTDQTTINSLVSKLVDSQLSNGSWPAAGACCDPSVAGKPYYAGSPALTTALALEALSLAATAMADRSADSSTLHAAIWNNVESEIVALPSPLPELAVSYLEKLKQTDKHHHIALFSTHFAHSISASATSPPLLQTLGEATIWGWLAYTTLDDVIDEMARPSLLPLSCTALSKLHSIYRHHFSTSPQFLELYDHLLHTMDAAMARELLLARATVTNNTLALPNSLPDYSDITVCAEKSIGHAIGPLAVLFDLGYDRYSQPVQLWLEFMHHYLTAKQLHDDAHDWEEDLKLGHLTPVVMLLLEDLTPSSSVVLDEKALTKLRLRFWQYTIDEVSTLITEQLDQARQAITHNTVITKPQLWFSLLDKIDHSTQKALVERDNALQFIAQYHS